MLSTLTSETRQVFPLCTGPGSLSFSPVAGIKYLYQSNLGERGFILAHGSRSQSITVGRSQWPKLTQVTLYSQPQGRQQGRPVLSSFCPFNSPSELGPKANLTQIVQHWDSFPGGSRIYQVDNWSKPKFHPTQKHSTLSQSPLLLDVSHWHKYNPTLKVPREWTLSVLDRAPKTGTKNDSTQASVKESPSLIGGIYKTPGSHYKGNVRLPATIKLPQSLHLQNYSPSITVSFWKNCDLENFSFYFCLENYF